MVASKFLDGHIIFIHSYMVGYYYFVGIYKANKGEGCEIKIFQYVVF